MSDHFTLRFVPGTAEQLKRRARAAGIPPRTLAARYIAEGLRRDDHPLIQFVDGATGRRASLIGTGLDVWEVIATVRDNDNDLAETAEYLAIPLGSVEAAVAYYGDFTNEIDDRIELNELASQRGLEAWRKGQEALRK